MGFATEQNITDLALERWSNTPDPRKRQLFTAMVKHLHAFVREVEPTAGEWLAATEFLTATGQISDEKRKEFILLSDVLGVSMLVVMINGRKPTGATPDTVLGPFHIDGSPELEHGAGLAGEYDGQPVWISGTVKNLKGEPVAGASIDIWQSDGEGIYEAQIPDCDVRLRGIQHSGPDGSYGFWTVAPKAYSIPMDGPVGAMVDQTDISPLRPAHIHFLVTAPGYRPVVTHLFREGSECLDTDVVFGAREELVVPFTEHAAGEGPDGKPAEEPYLTVDFDFVLAE